MSEIYYLIKTSTLTEIADAIRTVRGITGIIPVKEFDKALLGETLSNVPAASEEYYLIERQTLINFANVLRIKSNTSSKIMVSDLAATVLSLGEIEDEPEQPEQPELTKLQTPQIYAEIVSEPKPIIKFYVEYKGADSTNVEGYISEEGSWRDYFAGPYQSDDFDIESENILYLKGLNAPKILLHGDHTPVSLDEQIEESKTYYTYRRSSLPELKSPLIYLDVVIDDAIILYDDFVVTANEEIELGSFTISGATIVTKNVVLDDNITSYTVVIDGVKKIYQRSDKYTWRYIVNNITESILLSNENVGIAIVDYTNALGAVGSVHRIKIMKFKLNTPTIGIYVFSSPTIGIEDGVLLWSAIKDADRYAIYYKLQNGSYATIYTSSTSYNLNDLPLSDLPQGKTTEIQVEAIDDDNDIRSGLSNIVSYTRPEPEIEEITVCMASASYFNEEVPEDQIDTFYFLKGVTEGMTWREMVNDPDAGLDNDEFGTAWIWIDDSDDALYCGSYAPILNNLGEVQMPDDVIKEGFYYSDEIW